MAEPWDEEVDFLIVGSGAAAVAAALVVKQHGKRPLIIEKTELFGGSTSMSGGVMWIPNNPYMQAAGVEDSPAAARAYIDACAGPPFPGSSSEKRDAFIREGPKVIKALNAEGMKFVHAEGYSDYHEGEYPGGIARSRSLVGALFNVRRLGSWRDKLRPSYAAVPVTTAEAGDLGVNGRTLASMIAMARVGWRMLVGRLGHVLYGTGSAIQGRLLEIALRNKIDIRLGTAFSEFIVENGKITGVVATCDGKDQRIKARDGVLLNAGGFSRNQAMRHEHQRQPTGTLWTHANPGDTGESIDQAVRLGAQTGLMDQAVWVSTSIMPDGTRAIHPFDMAKPFTMMVDSNGCRFVNEATSYVEVGNRMYERHKTATAVPSWMIIDSRFLKRYRLGGFAPRAHLQEWLTAGYMKTGGTLADLARACSIDADGLEATAKRFNDFAGRGRDDDFGRGGSAYNRWQGDPTVKPNPSLGAIAQPPFYAIQLFPGDVGTSGGLITDERARVIGRGGKPLQGLYATGNTAASVFGASYPGAGASIGASMTFGWIAAHDACRSN